MLVFGKGRKGRCGLWWMNRFSSPSSLIFFFIKKMCVNVSRIAEWETRETEADLLTNNMYGLHLYSLSFPMPVSNIQPLPFWNSITMQCNAIPCHAMQLASRPIPQNSLKDHDPPYSQAQRAPNHPSTILTHRLPRSWSLYARFPLVGRDSTACVLGKSVTVSSKIWTVW